MHPALPSIRPEELTNSLIGRDWDSLDVSRRGLLNVYPPSTREIGENRYDMLW
jgi:hypothetical protein